MDTSTPITFTVPEGALALSIAVAFVLLFFFVVWSIFKRQIITGILKDQIQAILEKRFKEDYDDKLSNVFAKKTDELFQNLEKRLYDEVHLISLWSSGKYDEALDFIGFDGDLKFEEYDKPALKRVLLSCVSNTRKYRTEELRELAYKAAKELLDQEKSLLTIRIFLEISLRAKKYDMPIELYNDSKLRKEIAKDRAASSWMATALRRKQRFHDSAAISLRWAKSKDYQAVVGLAAALRDLGYYKSAHVWLQEVAKNILARPQRNISGAPKKVLNTYIANCIDAGYPEDSIDAACMLLQHDSDDVEIFTVSLLVLDLYDKGASNNELTRMLIPYVDALSPEIQKKEDCQLIIELTSGEMEAPGKVKEFIYRRLPSFSSMDYFKSTTISYLLYKAGDVENAIDLLGKTRSKKGGNGMAEHYLSIIYANSGKTDDAAFYIKASGEILPKWVFLVEKEKAVRNNPTLLKLIREFKAEQEQERDLIFAWFVENELVAVDDLKLISNN